MDKKTNLLEQAGRLFAEKGYKKTNISDITKAANLAVGSFYKYYQSKEELFLDVYRVENQRLRQKIMEEVGWQADLESIIESLFAATYRHLFANKILAEWQNPQIAPILHTYYLTEQGKKDNHFHSFLLEIMQEKLTELELDSQLSQQLMRVYDFIYYIDCHVTEADFEGYHQTIELLLKYFVKGLLADKGV